VGLREKLEAKARGEQPIAPLLAFGGANAEAYELLETVPPQGLARLASWCAFALQTYADKVLVAGNDDGYATPEACLQAQMLYELARTWLGRAQQAAANPDYRLTLPVPQSLPRPLNVPPERDQLVGMRATLEALQARSGVDLERAEPEVAARLRPSLAAMQSALDAAPIRGAHGAEAHAAVGRTLADGLEHGYLLGQLLAVPSLVLPAAAAPAVGVIAASGPGALGVFLPGDPAFDRWCLTDPHELTRLQASTETAAKLDAFWKSDPQPALTLRLQREIARELQAGTVVAITADTAGSLRRLTSTCPWPAVQVATCTLAIGGSRLERGDRFVLAVGKSDNCFTRGIARLSVHAGDAFVAAAQPQGEPSLTREILAGLSIDLLFPF
jgi:hypothetical protein